MDISKEIRYVGVDDGALDIFEGQYKVPFGVTYNSYVILDEKVAILDTVDRRAAGEWLMNIRHVLGDRKPDYLIIHHLEPDHSGGINEIAERFQDMKLVMTAKAKNMLEQFTGEDYSDRVIEVADQDEISLGEHTLRFLTAPMVHWPEVMMSFEKKEKVLFSADAFGSFGTVRNGVSWLVEARRYYFNIVGKYGSSVQAVLKKVLPLGVDVIAPLHGLVLKEDLGEYIDYYEKWSRYDPERKGIVIAYATAHGNTKDAVLLLRNMLQESGERVVTIDLNREDMARAVEDAFCFDRIVLAGITYDGELMPAMADLLYQLKIKKFCKRSVGIIENGSWAPMAAKKIIERLDEMDNIEILEPIVSIRTRVTKDTEKSLSELCDTLVDKGHQMDMNTL